MSKDPTRIICGDLKTILDTLWALIWHYSIASTISDNSRISNAIELYESKKNRYLNQNTNNNLYPKDATIQIKACFPVSMSRLLQWIQMKIPKLSITNFTSDWIDGKAVSALINSIAPGLSADHTTWNEKNLLNNLTDSMALARDWLDIQMLISPEELINGHASDKVLMVYLCQFTTAKLRSGAPLRAKRYSNRFAFNRSENMHLYY